MNDNDSQENFVSALESELGIASSDQTSDASTPDQSDVGVDDSVTPVTPSADEQSESADSEATDETPQPNSGSNDETNVATGDQSSEAKETAEEKANREDEASAKSLTVDDVRKAIREEKAEEASRVDVLHKVRGEIIEKIHPEGIDDKIYDSNGLVIKTAQDIVDRGLINEKTGEAFTYEEAASFMLDAGKKIAKSVDELNSWAEDVAEKNISLSEGNKRVMERWGDILHVMPKVAKSLSEKYISTQLTWDKTGSYIVNMTTTPEEFYDLMMPAYRRVGELLVAQNKQEQAETDAQASQEQSERNGLPPQRGQSDVGANTGDPFVDALIDEMNKG